MIRLAEAERKRREAEEAEQALERKLKELEATRAEFQRAKAERDKDVTQQNAQKQQKRCIVLCGGLRTTITHRMCVGHRLGARGARCCRSSRCHLGAVVGAVFGFVFKVSRHDSSCSSLNKIRTLDCSMVWRTMRKSRTISSLLGTPPRPLSAQADTQPNECSQIS